MKNNDNFKIGLLVCLASLAVMIAGCLVELKRVHNTLQDLLYYQAEADLCFEEARLVESSCHVERDTDGTFNWYYKPYQTTVDGTPSLPL